jgi:hypothetical protein
VTPRPSVSEPREASPVERATISGLTAVVGDLAAGESLEERIFATVRACLDSAGCRQSDVDAVVLSADDVADGRSITTMLHATAAGSYRRDEIRVTNGSLSALGLAALRVEAGLARRVLTVSWWLPTADVTSIGLAGLDAAYGRRIADPARLADGFACGACAACLVGADDVPGSLQLDTFAFGQADYDGWLTAHGEPDGLLDRLGRQVARSTAPFSRLDLLAMAPFDAGAWRPFADSAGIRPSPTIMTTGEGHGHATGLTLLTRTAVELGEGNRACVAATGVPPFLQAEVAVVTRSRDA